MGIKGETTCSAALRPSKWLYQSQRAAQAPIVIGVFTNHIDAAWSPDYEFRRGEKWV